MSNTSTSLQSLYDKTKRHVLGTLESRAEIKSTNAWLAIHQSSKDYLITYESSGLVVAINGSGTLGLEHNQCKQAAEATAYIVSQGGVVLNGGRNSGIMKASSDASHGKVIGVVFPELKAESSDKGVLAVVGDPHPRIELLSTCAPIMMIFRGGLGTFMGLMRAIVHLRNRSYHPDQLPQMVFVSTYWIGMLTTMMNLGVLPKEFIQELHFFDHVDEIIKKIPKKT